MGRMIAALAMLAGLAASAGPARADTPATTPDDLAVYYFNSDFWGGFDWASPGASTLAKLTDWSPYAGAQDGRVTLEKQRQVISATYQLTSALATQGPGDANPGMITLTAVLRPGVCEKLVAAMTKAFGDPLASDDTYYTGPGAAADQGLQRLGDQWDVNKTRITASCSAAVTRAGGDVRRGPVTFLATFTYTANTAKLQPPFLLDCTRTQASPATAWPKGLDDLTAWIVPDVRRVLDPALYAIAGPDSFDIRGSVITFTLADGATLTDYRVDRITGVMTAKARGADAGAISGVCAKLDPTQPKF